MGNRTSKITTNMTSSTNVKSKNLVARRLRQDIVSQKESRLRERLKKTAVLREKQIAALDFLAEQMSFDSVQGSDRNQSRILSSLVSQITEVFEFSACGLMWVNSNSMLELYDALPNDKEDRLTEELDYLRRTGALVRVLQNNKPALKESSTHGDWLIYHAIRTDNHVLGLLIGILPDQNMIDGVLLKLFEVILRNTAHELDHFTGENRRLADRLYRIEHDNIALEAPRMKFIADRDRLTSLPNRASFVSDLDILCANELVNPFVVISFDFEDFSRVNDSYGYAVGDQILLEASNRLEDKLSDEQYLEQLAVTSEGVHLARIGEDEFGLIVELDHQCSQEAVLSFVQGLALEMSKAYTSDNKTIRVDSNVGISCFPEGGKTSGELLTQAMHARLSVSQQAVNKIAFYQAAMGESLTINNLLRERELSLGLKDEQIRVWYQPKMNLESGEIIGAEALVRWQHPENGLLLPNQFLPLAESSGLVNELGECVLRDACELIAQADDAGFPDFTVAINLSPIQLMSEGFVDSFKAILSTHQASAERLELELTELSVGRDVEHIAAILTELADVGFNITLDDFGKGNTSLAILRNLPVKLLKIDQTFIQGLEKDNVNRAIVNALVSMGQDMNVKVIAEGVESEQQLESVRKLGCDDVQGYYVAKPSGLRSFEELMLEWKTGILAQSE